MRLLRRVASLSETEIAQRMGVNKSTVSRFLSDRLPQVVAFLTACDLDVVDQTDGAGVVTISSEEYQALKTLARKGL